MVVVGAGLAGLACARHLSAYLDDVVVLEAGDGVGGRVRTDHVDGFTLDRGFQVLNTELPRAGVVRRVDLGALELRAFDPAAVIQIDGRQYTLGNPLQRPGTVVGALNLPTGGLVGKAALASYAARCVVLPPNRIRSRDDVSSAQAWRNARVPDAIAEKVLTTFFSATILSGR